QLQGNAAQHLGACGHLTAGQRLEGLTVSRGMADRRIAGQCLHVVDGALVGPAEQRPLDAAVLVAQGYFQMVNLFAVALKAEMPRFDDAGVDRADRHLVNFLSRDAVIVGDADGRRLATRAAPGVMAGAVGWVKADGLEPGMPLRTQAP